MLLGQACRLRGNHCKGSRTSEQLIARDRELGVLLGAIAALDDSPRAVVLEGEAGVGKTALLRRALDVASGSGWRILSSAPAASEARLAFAALGDLLDLVIDEALPALPGPQRRSLEIALLRGDSDSAQDPIDERTIGVATLWVLRQISAQAPVLLAIDDLQWVDASSAAALRFALRRLRDERVLVLATRRVEAGRSAPIELERMLGDERVRRLSVEPLTLGGVHELLVARLGFDASRSTLTRLQELAEGNPFYSLEIGRELIDRGGAPPPDEALPVPGSVSGLVQARLGRLSPAARTVLLAAAALARPTRAVLSRLDDQAEAGLDEAVTAGLIGPANSERVRFAHPLFASVHYEQTPLAERRRIHARLSVLVEDLEQQARHLALSTPGVDERIAAQLDLAAGSAAARGGPRAAAELCDLAARLSPASDQRAQRVLASAEYHQRAGSLEVATDRAREALAIATGPGVRTRALTVLGTVAGDKEGIEPAAALYRRALREPAASRELRADLHQKLAWLRLLGADAKQAERHARAMLRIAEGTDPAAEAAAEATLSLILAARAQPVLAGSANQVRSTAGAGERPWAWAEIGAPALKGVVLLWAGEFEQARFPLEAMLRDAGESADPWSESHALAYLSALETNLGHPARGRELALRYLELAAATDHDAQRASALWPLTAAAGWLGRSEEARDAARQGLELAERTGHRLYAIGNLAAVGALELSLEEPVAAVAALRRAWELMCGGGVESPGRFPVLPDLIEALVAAGEVDEAAIAGGELRRIASELDRPWIRAQAARCDALVAEARGEEMVAAAAFERALHEHGLQDRPLDRARTLLSFGTMHRRRRQKSSARELLDSALECFEAAGAAQWAERTRVELGRIGGRRTASSGALSATESEIARLVAAGRTNREVADALHLSARTVEWNLSKLYRKLGVRSRTELARALGSGNHRMRA
ncbi:MAG TPA: AAA family ATPase [Solirubrobacteraceae bacterium]|nr:AAA family ATPase [Solirubrobacteraceae bacterium]